MPLIFDWYATDLAPLTNNESNPLTELDFSTFGQGVFGEPFLAAVTFATRTAAVPEPGTLALLGLGVAAGGLVRRKRR